MRRELIKSRNFRAYLAASVMTSAGTWIQKTALGWYLYQQTGSASSLAYLAAADAAPFLLLSLHAGWLSDRIADKLVAWRRSYLAQAAVFLGLAVVLFVDPDAHFFIYGSVAAASTLQTLQSPLGQIAIRSCFLEEEQLGMASTNAAINNASRFVGAWVGAAAYAHLGIQGVVAINAISFLFPYWLFRQIKPIGSWTQPAAANVTVLGGIKYLLSQPRMRAQFALLILTCLLGRPIVEQAPAIASFSGDHAIGSVANLLAALGGGALVAALMLPVAAARWSADRISMSGILLIAAASLSIALALGTWMALPAFSALGFGMVTHGAGLLACLQQSVAGIYLGRVIALFNVILRGLVAVGALALAGAVNRGALSEGLVVSAALIAAGFAVSFFVLRRRKS